MAPVEAIQFILPLGKDEAAGFLQSLPKKCYSTLKKIFANVIKIISLQFCFLSHYSTVEQLLLGLGVTVFSFL